MKEKLGCYKTGIRYKKYLQKIFLKEKDKGIKKEEKKQIETQLRKFRKDQENKQKH